MKNLYLVVVIILMSLFAKANGAPCFSASDDFSEARGNARAIFIGEVMKIEPLTSYLDGHLEIMRYRVTFKVEYSWKGAGFQELGLPELVVTSEQVLRAPQGLVDCFPSVTFSEGKKYLVYANETKDKSLMVGLGNGSKPLWNASEDLKELKKREAFFKFRVGQGTP